MGYRMWSVECGMDSVGDYCSKLSRCIFDAQVVGDIWDADRIEGRALAWPEDSSIYIYIILYIHGLQLYMNMCLNVIIIYQCKHV